MRRTYISSSFFSTSAYFVSKFSRRLVDLLHLSSSTDIRTAFRASRSAKTARLQLCVKWVNLFRRCRTPAGRGGDTDATFLLMVAPVMLLNCFLEASSSGSANKQFSCKKYII